MSESVRVMTREELFSECAKFERECLALSDKCKDKECQIKEMQSHIDCLKAELAEIQMKKQKLPDEPIRAAEMLIYATYKRTNCMTGKEYDKELYEPWELKQIADHLLVHCNHAEVE